MRRVNCAACGVRNEKLAVLSENTKYTLRFAQQIGGLCRAMTIKDVARLMHLDWHAVKDLDKIHMREQLRLAGPPKPRIIGVDEIAIGKGHSYRIVVSDLEARRAIWFGGTGRTEADMDLFYGFLGKKAAENIGFAVMDMWKAFRTATRRQAPQAAILFDKFHIVRHLSDALDKVRRSEYKRVAADDRRFIKGQRYVLLSRRENLTDDGRHNLERLLHANARLNIAYLLREQFEQLWDYASADDMRAFFDQWREQLRGQDLGAYEKFAAMVDRHWDGVAAHSQPTHKIPLGFVEGFNAKIRVLQRRAYGLRDEEYLKLKILTTGLPEL
jgi:transposase